MLLVFLRSAACRNLRETCLLALSFKFRFFIVSSSDYTKIGWSSNHGTREKLKVQSGIVSTALYSYLLKVFSENIIYTVRDVFSRIPRLKSDESTFSPYCAEKSTGASDEKVVLHQPGNVARCASKFLKLNRFLYPPWKKTIRYVYFY